MIPRYQRVLFWCFSAAIVLMALFMLRGCAQAREKFTRPVDQTPLSAPVAAPTETVHLALADDSTGTISLQDREVALPQEPTARLRVLLTRLLTEYSYKDSHHPLESGAAIDDVFLLGLPLRPASAIAGEPGAHAKVNQPTQSSVPDLAQQTSSGQLAVIDLHGTFADHHPSGIESEELTINSILQTIHANLPEITEVRFLVDGQPRETLNGHADLTRTYPVDSTSPAPSSQEAP